MSIRVVHLVEALEIGGIERMVQSLVEHCGRRANIEVFCAVRGGPVADAIAATGTPVRLLGITNYYAAGIGKTARALAKYRADVVHSHGHFAGVLARAAAWWSRVPTM